MSSNLPIGIFDSGVGGLTVMRAIASRLPAESLLYLGDTARVPYGNRSPQTIRRYAVNATTMLRDEGVKAIVVACNTASAYALRALQERYDFPVLGVVDPVARAAAAATATGAIGVIGTRGTVASNCYLDALHALGVSDVIQKACPLFVPLAEEGWTQGEVVDAIARSYLQVFAGTAVDTLILGCTHYPLLADTIGRVFEETAGRSVRVLDSASATAIALSDELETNALGSPEAVGALRFCATDDPAQFAETATRFFGAHLTDVEHVDIRDVSHE